MEKLCVTLLCLIVAACTSSPRPPGTIRVSVIGTNDVHGELVGDDRGLTVLSGYLRALREQRRDDGVVLLLDAGDMWQGTLESNLSEGQSVVAAYNALGYDAAAVGNHEFDFGPVGDAAIPEQPGDDPRGALRRRASEANFPLLAANLIDGATGQPVAWDNVSPTVMLQRKGIQIGIVGVTTAETLEATIAANTGGLRIAPLAATIEARARELRARGADLVLVVSHAGGHCREFDDPFDLGSCDADTEVFEVARALPAGLVDQIIAGHRHRGIAHVVNGIAITSNLSSARTFGRVDYAIDPVTRRVTQRIIHPPRQVCRYVIAGQTACASVDDNGARLARYADRAILIDPKVAAIGEAAAARAQAVKEAPLGVVLTRDITLEGKSSSALGRLITDAIREATGADMAIHNVVGGIRANLPAGPLTFGDVYRAFPFDNRIAVIYLSVAEIKAMLARQVPISDRIIGFSGVSVTVSCAEGVMNLSLQRSDGSVLRDDDVLTVAANDYLLLGGGNILTPITPDGGFVLDASQPRVRDVWADWFRARGRAISADDYEVADEQRWMLPRPFPTECRWQQPVTHRR